MISKLFYMRLCKKSTMVFVLVGAELYSSRTTIEAWETSVHRTTLIFENKKIPIQ